MPADLQDRRTEITGPVDRKMVVNALNSGASVYMADFEDATTPTWANLIEGQINLRDAIRREIDFTDPDSGKRYRLDRRDRDAAGAAARLASAAKRICAIDGQPMSGALFDFGLYVFHNASELRRAAPAPISIWRSWRAISRRGCGTTCSGSQKSGSASRRARSRRRC